MITMDRGVVACPNVPARRRCESTTTASRSSSSTIPCGTRLRGSWTERDGSDGRLDVYVALPDGHESLNVVIPWNDERFNYTSKHQARPATGELRSVIAAGRSARTVTRGVCSTSAGDDGPTRSHGTGEAVRDTAAIMSSGCSSARSGPRGRATPRTA